MEATYRSCRLKRWLVLLVAPLGACSSLRNNVERSTNDRPQASDALVSNRELGATVLRSTLVAALRQPVTTTRSGLSVLWNRPAALIDGNFPLSVTADPPDMEPGSEAFERRLDRLGCPRRRLGTLAWLVDGRNFFPELDRQLAGASFSVDFQVFIFDNDDIAVRYADRLKAVSKDRKVRVLFDDLGSTVAQSTAPDTPASGGFVPVDNIEDYLEKDSRVSARRSLNPWLVCDHTKLMVFDKCRALLGGMNIGREYYSEWHDLMMRVEGPVVRDLSREFNRSWRKAGPLGDFALFNGPGFHRRVGPGTEGVPLRMLKTDPVYGNHTIHEATVLAIRCARKRIWIENPYFAHDGIRRELQAAARRGVDVRVILPSKSDSALMEAGNLATAADLIAAGGKVYRYPRMTHMKAMICDGWAQAGSANLDTLSMRINRELNLAVADPKIVGELERVVFQRDFAASRLLRKRDTNSPLAPLAEAVADQL